jgi:hypothetical protein|eukprot:SAG25_NODE_855_length_5049_cov_23.766667_3_plen_91_part_00
MSSSSASLSSPGLAAVDTPSHTCKGSYQARADAVPSALRRFLLSRVHPRQRSWGSGVQMPCTACSLTAARTGIAQPVDSDSREDCVLVRL